MAIDAAPPGVRHSAKRTLVDTLPPAKKVKVMPAVPEPTPKQPVSAAGDAAELDSAKASVGQSPGAMQLFACAIGLQVSYLTWGYMQEKVMTTTYSTGKFPSTTFCVFSNRVVAVLIGMLLSRSKHGSFRLSAPLRAFAPCSLSNSVSSFAQYQALRYVSFPLQTLAKSAKIIPVMCMGKVLNGKQYATAEYVEALLISLGVSLFSLSQGKNKADAGTQMCGIVLLAVYIAADSFTSQWQSRVYKDYPKVDHYQMMYATNAWSIFLTLSTLLASGEFLTTLEFLHDNPDAVFDNIAIAVTSATGQLLIFYTIKTFGPVIFTIIMTTRQMFSLMLSAFVFGHIIGIPGYVGAGLVFAMVFAKIQRESRSKSKKKTDRAQPPQAPVCSAISRLPSSNSVHLVAGSVQRRSFA